MAGILYASLFLSSGLLCWSLPSDNYSPRALKEDVIEMPVCHYRSTREAKILAEPADKLLADGKVQCSSSSDYCFSYWTYENRTDGGEGVLRWLAQGCFSSQDSCRQESCAASRESPKNTFFCCCSGSLCNKEVSVPQELRESAGGVVQPLRGTSNEGSPGFSPDGFTSHHVLLYLVLPLVAFVCLVLISALVAIKSYHRIFGKFSKDPLAAPLDKTPLPSEKTPALSARTPKVPLIDIQSLVLTDIIGRGRYGCVYKATSEGKPVVVKVFSDQEKSSYDNELFMYSHPFMNSPNLLSLLGCGPLATNQWGLVLPYCSGGRLISYLTDNTLSWDQMCHITLSIARGLAHLHAPIVAFDGEKPSMSHRDLNSRNIVLKQDLTAVVIDLGLAVCIKDGAPTNSGQQRKQGCTPALNEAGSLRYMAPELLEGAVNLTECETALRQIDVYALGLVLWECFSRCHDIVEKVMPFTLPFQTEIGNSPTMDLMVEHVVHAKKRPLFAPLKKDLLDRESLAVRSLMDTIEDCWDADAEARLSAHCVVERLAHLPRFWRGSQGSSINKYSSSEGYERSFKSDYLNSQDSLTASDNCYSDSLVQNNSFDMSELPGYSKQPYERKESSNYTDSLSCRKFLRGSGSLESCGEQRQNLLPNLHETSTRTVVTMLSPSASFTPHTATEGGKESGRRFSSNLNLPNALHSNDAFGHLTVYSPEDAQLCSSVIQNGSSGPVSILHHPVSAPQTASSLPQGDKSQVNGFTKFWSKLRRKFLSSPSTDETCEQMLPNVTNVSIESAYNRLSEKPSKQLLVDLPPQESVPQYSDTSKESSLTSFATKSSNGSSKVPFSHLPVDRWCNTVPGRKSSNSYWHQYKNRPASLEIRRSSLENSSPLANYLSISGDFKNPEEVVLKKSKTRIKTPRHPPLPRISLNESDSR